MKDANRNAIRQVLAPTAYPLMLVTSDGCYCSNCTRNTLYTLLADLRSGYADKYWVFNTAETDQPVYCERCSESIGWCDLSEDPVEADMQDAADSLYDPEY